MMMLPPACIDSCAVCSLDSIDSRSSLAASKPSMAQQGTQEPQVPCWSAIEYEWWTALDNSCPAQTVRVCLHKRRLGHVDHYPVEYLGSWSGQPYLLADVLLFIFLGCSSCGSLDQPQVPSCSHPYTFDILRLHFYPEIEGSVAWRNQAWNTVKGFNRSTVKTCRTCVSLSCTTLTTTRLFNQLKPLFCTRSVAFSWAVRSCVVASVALASESCRAGAASGCHDLHRQQVQPELQRGIQSTVGD